jgi:hypothetical protein
MRQRCTDSGGSLASSPIRSLEGPVSYTLAGPCLSCRPGISAGFAGCREERCSDHFSSAKLNRPASMLRLRRVEFHPGRPTSDPTSGNLARLAGNGNGERVNRLARHASSAWTRIVNGASETQTRNPMDAMHACKSSRRTQQRRFLPGRISHDSSVLQPMHGNCRAISRSRFYLALPFGTGSF